MHRNKIKKFWMIVLLIMFLFYLYYYKYGNNDNEGFTIPGTEFINSVKRDVRKTTESISETIGPEAISKELTAMQYKNSSS